MRIPIAALALALSSSVSAVDISQYIDALTLRATSSSGMDLENSPVEFDYTEVSLLAFITKPIDLGGNWTAISYVNLETSKFNFDGNALIGAFGDDLESDLYRVGIPFVIAHFHESSRWTYGAWINPEISSDFKHIDGDDFYVSGAIAAGYKVNECFTIGGGIYVSDIFHDVWAIPGIGFAWVPNEDWLIAYYGPRFVARYDINERNQVGLEVANNGGVWNIDANNNSLEIDYQSWRSGLYYRYNLTGELWLEAAAGFTFANEFDLNTRGGTELFPNRLGKAETGTYGFIGLSVARW